MNQTHDPDLRSWVESANESGTEFPIQNLPYGVFRRKGGEPRVGVAIGSMVLDVAAAVDRGLLSGVGAEACTGGNLNALMAQSKAEWSELRSQISTLLSAASGPPEGVEPSDLLVPMAEVTLLVPAEIGDYTDFYASIHHATNVGSLFRPDNPLLPNYRWIPIGYHGRASSIVASGTPIKRPSGQKRPEEGQAPGFGPSRAFDYELEVGAYIGTGNVLGDPIPLEQAEDHLFGICLLNDWSARDIQGWEYQPLGPFLGKSFASTVSPWIITAEALEPFRIPAFERAEGDPEPLPYLTSQADRERGGVSLDLEVFLLTAAMRERGDEPFRLSRGDFSGLYWTLAQMITHHSSNGCNLRPGDLIGSGTVSGPTRDSRGCMLELTWRGAEPLTLPDGDTRAFLQDGDEVLLRGRCVADGRVSIGFGECRGMVVSG